MGTENTLRVLISPKDLVLTRDNLDMKKVNSMTNDLLNGTVYPEELTTPLVTPVEKSGYMVADGNHSVSALKNAGVNSIEVEVYKKH